MASNQVGVDDPPSNETNARRNCTIKLQAKFFRRLSCTQRLNFHKIVVKTFPRVLRLFFSFSSVGFFFWQLNLFAIHGDVAKDDFQTNNKVTKIYDEDTSIVLRRTRYLMSSRKFSATMLRLFS
jgi:hypothetical protein